MSDATNNKYHLLEQITAAMQAGGQLTVAVLDYIDAALFPPDPDRLAAFLSDDAGCERDSLMDLIFYPDHSVQIALEPLLAEARCSADDEKVLLGRLIARKIDAMVSLPGGRPLARIQLPDFIKSQYLARLKVSWQMDSDVAAAIETGVSEAIRPHVKVRLRNAGFRSAANRSRFLCHFFERMADSDPDYLACLDLALSLLASAKMAADVYDLLVEHKCFLFRSLQQAGRFEVLLRQSNMETLMLQGFRAPHVSRDDLLREMRLIDLICSGIFGKTEAIAPPMEEPVRQVSDLDTPEAVIQSLMR
ncbi:MAG: hypothetical protein HGJ94_05845 [Desulfosarcina sp.]|nr:hypothetical protein [Desulfosarcina sp.]MBC2743899.1 hypothetical protein [Desulfosarcina sp.]MBC2766808.1 hypothetical protein [Desulfosarcina sp.]